VAAIVSRDQAGMSQLYDRYAGAILGLAMRITHERADAEDVVVDTFAQVWRDAARFEQQRGSVASWIATIARSRSLDLLRARLRRHKLNDSAGTEADIAPAAMGAPFPSPMAELLSDERSRNIQAALATLPEAQRQALELAYFEGLSQTEIAERLDQPLGTVKTRVRLGLRRLRDVLAPFHSGALR
jgi:RNA polymerase sigma-70 factor (ECF subfamily)